MEKIKKIIFPLKGFYLLPQGPVPGYRGIDRTPFLPLIIGDDVEQENFAPRQEWRRKAYEIFNANLVDVGDKSIHIISNIQAANEIRALIEPYLGFHEIIYGEIWELGMAASIPLSAETGFIGYDVAYPRGDYYSAILNGLFLNDNDGLYVEFKHLLNGFGLFDTPQPIPLFVQRFKQVVLSEQNSTFAIFRLYKQLID